MGRKLRNQKTFYITQAFSFMGKDVQCSVSCLDAGPHQRFGLRLM